MPEGETGIVDLRKPSTLYDQDRVRLLVEPIYEGAGPANVCRKVCRRLTGLGDYSVRRSSASRRYVGIDNASVPAEHTWERPGGAASIGFHVRHLGDALDRLFTYARGEALSDTQKAAMRAEGDLVDPAPSLADVAADMNASIERALEQLRTTTRDDLRTARTVGRAGLPTTTLGLLFHAAEHSTRHAGQAISTAKILAGS